MAVSVSAAFREVSLVDRLAWHGVRGSCSSTALVLADIDEDRENELLFGSFDGRLRIWKGAHVDSTPSPSSSSSQSADRPILTLHGFGTIQTLKYVKIRRRKGEGEEKKQQQQQQQHQARSRSLLHQPVEPSSANSATSSSTDSSTDRLLIINSEGDLFVLEFDRERFASEVSNRASVMSVDSVSSHIDSSSPPPPSSSLATTADDGTLTTNNLLEQHYQSSTFIRSAARLSIPLNVAAIDWVDIDSDGEDELVLATLDRSIHVYSLFLERDASELALELAESSSEHVSFDRSREDSLRGRTSASPVISFANPSRRTSITPILGGSLGGGPAILHGMAAPILQGSSNAQSTNISAQASRDASPALHGKFIPQPTILSSVNNLSSTTNSPLLVSAGRRSPVVSAATSTAHTPNLGGGGGPILSAINSFPSLSSSPITSTSPVVKSATPTLIGGSVGATRKNTWHHRLELKRQVLHIPLSIHGMSHVSASDPHIAMMVRKGDLLVSPTSPDPVDSATPDPALSPSSSKLLIPSNAASLIPMVQVDPLTLHMLPSIHFQRGIKTYTSTTTNTTNNTTGNTSNNNTSTSHQYHQRAPSHTQTPSHPSQTMSHSASSASIVGMNSSHHGSLKDIPGVIGARDSPGGANVYSSMLSKSMVVRAAAGGGAGGVASSANSRKNSGTTSTASPAMQPSNTGTGNNTSMFLSPQLIQTQGPPSASPKYGSINGGMSSPRFGFIGGPGGPTGHASGGGGGVNSSTLYSTSVSASPAWLGVSNSSSTLPPSFSLGGGLLSSEDPLSASPTLLEVAQTLLLIALDEGVLLVDIAHAWAKIVRRVGGPPNRPTPLHTSLSALNITTATPTPHTTTSASAQQQSQPQYPSQRSNQVFASPLRGVLTPSGVPVGGAFSGHRSDPPPLQRTSSAPGMAHLDSNTGVGTLPSSLTPSPSTNLLTLTGSNHPSSHPHTQSASSTPILRPAPPKRQPSGINLHALNEAPQATPSLASVGGSSDLPSPPLTKLSSSLASGLTTPAVSACDGSTPLLSPSGANTPRAANSATPSRSASNAALSGLIGSQHHSSSGVSIGGGGPVSSGHGGDMVRSSLLGDVPVVGPSGRRSTGCFAIIDALGRFYMHHVDVQLGMTTMPATTMTATTNDSNQTTQNGDSSWYQQQFDLPGQFLGLGMLPIAPSDLMSSIGCEREQAHVLVACSLDGWIYFIPSLPLSAPPMPLAMNCDEEDGATGVPRVGGSLPPLTLTRFHHPTRIQSFTCGLYSFLPGRPVPVIVIVDYQGSIILFHDVIRESGLEEWNTEWVWTPRTNNKEINGGGEELPTPANTGIERATSQENTPLPAEGDATQSASVGSSKPSSSYELSVTSRPRTIFETWLSIDEELAAVDAASALEPGEPNANEECVSFQALIDLTTNDNTNDDDTNGDADTNGHTRHSSHVSTLPTTVESASSHLRALALIDHTILDSYRSHLRRMVAEAEEELQSSSIVPEVISPIPLVTGGSPVVAALADHPLNPSPTPIAIQQQTDTNN